MPDVDSCEAWGDRNIDGSTNDGNGGGSIGDERWSTSKRRSSSNKPNLLRDGVNEVKARARETFPDESRIR